MHLNERELNCLALVLRAQPYGDKDLIFTLLTEKTGKIGVIAKGAKAGKKFSSGIPEIMDLGLFELHRGRANLFNVVHFKPQIAFKRIRSNLHLYICSCCWIESLDLLTSEAHQDSHELFEISVSVLRSLDESSQPRNSCKILCCGLEAALQRSGFGSEYFNQPNGFKKMNALVKRIEEVSGRQLKSWDAVTEVVRQLDISPPC